MFHSMDNSPLRKWIAGVGAAILSVKIDFKAFLWNRKVAQAWQLFFYPSSLHFLPVRDTTNNLSLVFIILHNNDSSTIQFSTRNICKVVGINLRSNNTTFLFGGFILLFCTFGHSVWQCPSEPLVLTVSLSLSRHCQRLHKLPH